MLLFGLEGGGDVLEYPLWFAFFAVTGVANLTGYLQEDVSRNSFNIFRGKPLISVVHHLRVTLQPVPNTLVQCRVTFSGRRVRPPLWAWSRTGTGEPWPAQKNLRFFDFEALSFAEHCCTENRDFKDHRCRPRGYLSLRVGTVTRS